MTPEFIDGIITAELPPDPKDSKNEEEKLQRERLQDIVVGNMLHGPCGEKTPDARCMENGKCSKSFPKEFFKETIIDPDGTYVTYRRRSPKDGGRTVQHNGRTIDNSWVVPYNAYLSLRHNCHINVEATASPKAIKYLFKYVTKGNDRMMARSEMEGEPRDEIKEYQDMRTVSSGEACHHIFGFPITDRYPAVFPMRVHLNEQQQIYFDEDAEMMALENQRETELTAFFKFNQEKANVDSSELPKYVSMPKKFRYDQQKKKWVERKLNLDTVIGRVHYINPVAGEVYFLRILLHDNFCRGKKSFNDMLILSCGKVCETYKQVCCELGLLADDQEWHRALEEASVTQMCPQLRELFVMILMFCFPSSPLALLEEFWLDFCDDFKLAGQRRGIELCENQLKTMLMLNIELRLSSFEKTLSDFGLPSPSIEEIAEVSHVTCTQPAVIREELEFNVEDLKSQVCETVPTFTQEQTIVYNLIMEAVKNQTSLQVFLSARGGCGKTYLLNAILDSVRSLEPGGCVALAMATTGIAAGLLKLGRTFHSRLKAPLTADENSTLNISAQSNLAKLIRMSKLFLIDEATMLDKHLLEAFDRTLRDLMNEPSLPFGGKIVILAGDFRQCLPVVPKSNRPGIISHVVSSSHLWPFFRVLHLTENMRVRSSGDKRLEAFDSWSLSVGNGVSDTFVVPDDMLATVIKPNTKVNPRSEGEAMEQFCNAVFPDLPLNIKDRKWIEGRAILAPVNKEVNMLNELLCSKMPGDADILRSADVLNSSQDGIKFSTEYLNTLMPNGFPPHSLYLKPGMPLMLLRNLNPKVSVVC